jgi:cobalt-precorrin 5A hydrolase/precorrin-3B C17-methyltransferase
MINQLTLERLESLGGWSRGFGDWPGVAAVMARGERVEVIQEVGCRLWKNFLLQRHSLCWDGDNLSLVKARIWISFRHRRLSPASALPQVQWHPKVLWVGIGCTGGTSRKFLESAIKQVCDSYDLASSAIAGIATIDTKANEAGIVQLCQEHNWPLKTFCASVLNAVEVPHPSNMVVAKVGTKSVAEAAALGAIELGYCPVVKNRQDACSTKSEYGCGVGKMPTHERLLVPKQIFRSEEKQGCVTVAVAVCPIAHLRSDVTLPKSDLDSQIDQSSQKQRTKQLNQTKQAKNR